MAHYQIMYWQDIPAQVKVSDDHETLRRILPDRFQQSIDGAAMAEGSSGAGAYLDGWQWAPKEERPGTAQEVVDALFAELDAAYPKTRLAIMVRSRMRRAQTE